MTEEGAKLTSYSGGSSSVNFTESSDLLFGLRGAGASLGVVTEFLYTVHPHPETKAVVLLVLVTKVSKMDNDTIINLRSQFKVMLTWCFETHLVFQLKFLPGRGSVGN